jgi:spore coat protein CotF
LNINLSQKERMLLEDQKSHEQICIDKYNNYANKASDEQLKQICKNNEQIERNHLDSINQLLNGTVPQMNAGQSQGSNQSSTQSNQWQSQGANQWSNKSQNQGSTQSSNQTMSNNQSGQSDLSDKDICSDLLMTEKYVSGNYDTAIFECKDTEVRDVLNHIQKEEQKHGEAIFKYMESKGMYNPQ